MLNVNSNSGATTASNRVRRAQQLRQQRLQAAAANKANVSSPSKPSSPSSEDSTPMDHESKEDEILVISGIWTIVAALAIVLVGAVLAIIFFLFYRPDCMRGILWGASTDSLPTQTIATKPPPIRVGSR